MRNNCSLILEGGGMRGVYTAGILEYFMEIGLEFPYVIGVSAGVCQALSFISKQPGRNKKVSVDMAVDPRYIRYRGILDGTGLFNMNFIFNDIPNKLIPYDYDTFYQSTQKLIAVATNCENGEPVYLACQHTKSIEELTDIVKASCSLPLMAPVVKVNDMELLDGGLADSIPIEKSIKDGNNKNVVILTRYKGYRKKPVKGMVVYRLLLGKGRLGAFLALKNRYKHYNETLDKLVHYEKEGLAFVFSPSEPLHIKRAEKDKDKLERLYQLGYDDAKKRHEELMTYLTS